MNPGGSEFMFVRLFNADDNYLVSSDTFIVSVLTDLCTFFHLHY